MKLFKFYPNEFCRMYVIGNSLEEVQSRVDELFGQYMKDNYSWLDLDDPDEADYIEELKETFTKGLQKLEELPSGIAIDSHY
jgi:SMC interacting uncharacterized protein involved in chromosome segregation